MIEKINTIKQDKFFETEQLFFHHYKKEFTQNLIQLLESNAKDTANDFYDALFDYGVDCYEKQLYCVNTFNKGNLNIDDIFSILFYRLIKAFLDYKELDASKSISKLIQLCSTFQTAIVDTIIHKQNRRFDVAPLIEKKKYIKYLSDICKQKENITFISYKESKTDIQSLDIEQIGKNSIVIKTTKEHISTLKESSSSFMVIDKTEKEYFSASVKFFCNDDSSVILENITKLESQPLLNRKYPRASIAHNSVIQIVSKNEHITGSLIDISEGGIGVLSLTKSTLQKGQDVSVLVSYKDEENGVDLNFESSGILTSIIGKEHAFRYGVELILSDEKRELIGNLVDSINKKRKLHKLR